MAADKRSRLAKLKQETVAEQPAPSRKRQAASATEAKTRKAPLRRRKTIYATYEDSAELVGTVKQLEAKFGQGTVFHAHSVKQPVRIPTGIFILDMHTLGGIPNSRASMILGEKHSGKTTLFNKVTRAAQLCYPDSVVALVEPEGTFDREWAAKCGVDLDRLLINQPETGEQAGDVLEALMRCKEVCYAGLDSLATLAPSTELEGSMTDNHMGLQARLINRIVRKITSDIVDERRRGHEVGIYMVNQWRTNIGQMFGDNRTVAGGRAVQHMATLELHLKNREHTGKSDVNIEELTFNEHSFDIKKNKMNAGARSGEFKLMRAPLADGTLFEGATHDASTMLTYAKNLGMYTGGGKNQKIILSDREINFGSQNDFFRDIYLDPDLYWQLRCELIATQAKRQRMPVKFIESILQQPNLYRHDMENARLMSDDSYFED